MKDCKPAPKRLIICCDGTWQSSVTGKRNIPSNVVRLARAIAKAGVDDDGKQWQQVVFYDSGIGTGSLHMIEKARQGASGDGLITNVLEAYNFLVNNYNQGDKVYCFGFSRGAFTARCVAGLVTDIGIFKPESMQAFAPLWEAYQTNTSKHEFRKTKEYFQYVNGIRPMVEESKVNEPYYLQFHELPYGQSLTWGPQSHEVEVVGCFDTVGSLGLGDTWLFSNKWSRERFEFLNVKLSPYIKHAFHALALDEHREPFVPTLWYIPSPQTLQNEKEDLAAEGEEWPALKAWRDEIDRELDTQRAKHPPDLYQVWFPGVHISVGGGTDGDSYDGEGLANLTYVWMIQMLGPHLAFEPWTWSDDGFGDYPHRVMAEQERYDEVNPPTMEGQLSRNMDWLLKLGREKLMGPKKMVPVPPEMIRPPQANPTFKNVFKPIYWGTQAFEDSYTFMYKVLNHKVNRAPGESEDRSTEKRTPLRILGRTEEYIHPSVEWRRLNFVKDGGDNLYDPPALAQFKRVQDPKRGPGYVKKGVHGEVYIPEWFIKPTPNARECDLIWQTAEWELTNHTADCDDVQPWLRKIYDQATAAGRR